MLIMTKQNKFTMSLKCENFFCYSGSLKGEQTEQTNYAFSFCRPVKSTMFQGSLYCKSSPVGVMLTYVLSNVSVVALSLLHKQSSFMAACGMIWVACGYLEISSRKPRRESSENINNVKPRGLTVRWFSQIALFQLPDCMGCTVFHTGAR